NATADQVKACAVGVLVALRVDVTRWVLNNGILGRESYRLDTADPRFTTELLAGPLDPSNDAFGGGQWAAELRATQGGYASLKVNRALAARVQAYRASPSAPGVACTACWDTVLTNLAASFIDPAAPLDMGVYHSYSTGNQDVTNGLSQDPASAIQLAHRMVKD